MKIKCNYCDTYIDDTLAICPHCGAANKNVSMLSEKEREDEVHKAAIAAAVEEERIRAINTAAREKTKRIRILVLAVIFVFLAIVASCASLFHAVNRSSNSHDGGYYLYDDVLYYHDYSSWYKNTGYDEWEIVPEISGIDEGWIGYKNEVSGKDFKHSGFETPDETNYYLFEEKYYFFQSRGRDFFMYDAGAWKEISFSAVPIEIRKYPENYSTSDWQNKTCPEGVTDFRLTSYYEPESGYYYKGDEIYYYSGWYWCKWNGTDYDEVTEPEDLIRFDYTWNTPSGVKDWYDSKLRKQLYK